MTDQTALQTLLDEEHQEQLIENLQHHEEKLKQTEMSLEELDELQITIPVEPENIDVIVEELQQ
jgi:hypothetical protein